MLWIPDRKTLKALARLKRRRRRRRFARILLFLFLIFGLRTATAPPAGNLLVEVETVTAPYQFDFINWESQAIASEIGRRLIPLPVPTNDADQRTLVDEYLGFEEEIHTVERDLDRIYATSNTQSNIPEEAKQLEQKLAQLKNDQAKIVPQVETILAHQLEAVLHDEGFVIAGRAFPPVAFRLIDPPTALILSPRDRIENEYFVGLQPGLDNSIRTQIEDKLDQRGDISSYVVNVGGLGSYPTIVINTSHLPGLLETISHEWVHNYLFTFPTNISWGYQTYPKLTTINETTATIVGKELSRKVITRFYPDWIDRLPPVDNQGIPIPREPSEFDLAMRRIRLRVDQLLAAGQIEEAEAYMEVERQKLVEKGYNLRKLNQAYFAFYGSYAFGPDSVDPIGPQIRQLRTASSSLKDFLSRVGWLNSYDDYLAWLDEFKINIDLKN